MALKINPITGKLDYFLHHGIASYNFLGWKDLADPTAPAVGGMYFNVPDMYTYQLILNPTDKYGNDVGYLLYDLAMYFEIYHVWFFIHSKRNPTVWTARLLDDFDAIIVDDEPVAYAIDIYPFYLNSMKYNEEEAESEPTEFVTNEEVLISLEFAFNPGYIGTIGTQDYNAVSISGGSISTTSIYSPSLLELPVKVDTGDPAGTPNNGRIYINAYDKKVRLYIGDVWKTIFDFA